MSNSLAGDAGLKIGPIVLETLVKHYFNRLKDQTKAKEKSITKLRQDELLYDEAFNVVKAFLEAASHHTIEEVQSFSNTRTPSPPWVKVVRLRIPMSCCDEAATHLIEVLGGEEHAKRVVGGTKWWQVRSINGVDAQWISTKKDWQERHRRMNLKQRGTGPGPGGYAASDPEISPPAAKYDKEMDEMRCILYAHGGGYYFGSVDQERYAIQRHARKINGRVFAINYRLAPQYPFPCAVQDILAAYLFLIKPPSEASHCAVNPANIIVAGDSAGGGLTLALLQVLRDSGLPLPAGGVLVSPWCDLTHSFPSIHTNVHTDIVPFYGLSRQKPSTLWPPPSEELSSHVHTSIRSRIRQTLGIDSTTPDQLTMSSKGPTVNVGKTMSLSPLDSLHKQAVSFVSESGETLRVDQQIQFYAQNNQLGHPLVSSVHAYLGGLPPLLFIAGDREVLRDEIIYAAHKAANPDKFPVKEETRQIYPPLKGVESRYSTTPVHLQVYDDTPHVLPVLFGFTSPGKFCYRAIATFMKQVTCISPEAVLSTPTSKRGSISSVGTPPMPYSPSPKRRFSWYKPDISRRSTCPTEEPSRPTLVDLRQQSDVTIDSPFLLRTNPREAGDSVVYSNTPEFPSWNERMIRERVSTRGIIRPLEPEEEIPALQVPLEKIGVFTELAVRRYLDGQAKLTKKFSGVFKTVEKHRRRHLECSKKDSVWSMEQFQQYLQCDDDDKSEKNHGTKRGIREGLAAAAGSWSWAWAVDCENPPPSSIVSRRDTSEARQLARIADQCVLTQDPSMSGNNLWSVLSNFLTTSPDKDKVDQKTPEKDTSRRKSAFSAFFPGKSDPTSLGVKT